MTDKIIYKNERQNFFDKRISNLAYIMNHENYWQYHRQKWPTQWSTKLALKITDKIIDKTDWLKRSTKLAYKMIHENDPQNNE